MRIKTFSTKILIITLIFIINFCSGTKDKNPDNIINKKSINYKEVINNDKPLKGEWDFELKSIWSIDNVNGNPLVNIRNIRIDKSGNLYFIDKKYGKIFCLNRDGKYQFKFGTPGEGPGEFRRIGNLFLTKTNLIIRDAGNIIKIFNKKGKYENFYKQKLDIFPRDFIDKNEYITIRGDYDYKPGEKKRLETIEIINMEEKKNKVLAYVLSEKKVDESYSSGPVRRVRLDNPAFTHSLIIAKTKHNFFYGRNDKFIIKKLDLSGNELLAFSIKARTGKKISKEFKKKYIKDLRIDFLKGISDKYANQLVNGISNIATCYEDIIIDESGFIYVFVTDVKNKNGKEIEIFSPEGEYLYHSEIKLPEGNEIKGKCVMNKNHIFINMIDEEGNTKLGKYIIKTPVS